jgi:membrane associated rhomboid family serine protease
MVLPEPPQPTVTTCYRHPDRETGRRCTRCGKPACSECLVQATVGSHCLDCVKQAQPDLKTRVKYANARQNTLVTYVLIAVNVAVFVWVATGDSTAFGQSFGRSGSITPRQFEIGLNPFILRNGATVPGVGTFQEHEWYRLVTSGFLHFGILHLLLNMYLLYLLGQMLEPVLGRTRFALLYFAALLGGSAGVLVLSGSNDVTTSGGASGAVFGLMGAAAISMHQRGVNIMQTGVGRTLLLNLVFTFLIPGISIGGHLGGVVIGGICGAVMLAPKWKAFPVWVTYAAPVVLGAVAVAVCVVRVV